MTDPRTDEQLLLASRSDNETFAVFYRRHVERVLRCCSARTREPEQAADLMAETFAAAYVAVGRFRPGPEPPVAWLFVIARRERSRLRVRRPGPTARRAGRPPAKQTSIDRGEAASYALRFFGSKVDGVRTDSVRVLRDQGGRGAAVLVPVASYKESGTGSQADGLRLFVRDAGHGGAQGCRSLQELRDGLVQGAMSDGRTATLYGVVPDPVSDVRVRIRGGAPITAPVKDNFYEFALDPSALGGPVEGLDWLDPSGTVVKTQAALVPPPTASGDSYTTCNDGKTHVVGPTERPADVCKELKRKR